MDAQELGAKQGLEYARICPIENMTFAEYCEVGTISASRMYRAEKARFGFLFGWRQAGEVNRTIFKLDDHDLRSGERKLQVIRTILRGAAADLEAVLPWREDEEALHELLIHAYTTLDQVQYDLDCALKLL